MKKRIRPWLRQLLFAAAFAGLSAPLMAGDLSNLRFELLSRDLLRPTSITHAGDARLFITLAAGQIVVYENDEFHPQPFLDIRDRVKASGFEQGLLGLAFHPRHGENGYFFVHYTRGDNAVVVARFELGDNPSTADASSEKVLLTVPQPTTVHNGGQLQFGPDGFLYVALGDGGGANDPFCRAQDTGSLLGKILRLDVDSNAAEAPYHVPAPGNPFLDQGPARAEIWAYGLRNPWRFSFDRASGDLFIADVGQNQREEINIQPAASNGGENYGWKVMEGGLCTGDAAGCSFPLPACDAPELTAPTIVYSHNLGCAVIGGYVYRGRAIPDLQGAYLLADFCSGLIATVERAEGSLSVEALPQEIAGIRTFGEDAAGEIYLATGNELYLLVDQGQVGCRPDATTLCLNRGRFEVRATWRTPDGQEGPGQAVDLVADAGYFYFFSENNPELFVKVLDGCFDPFNAFWVFAAGLTDVGVTLTVHDRQTDTIRTWESPSGTLFQSIRDLQAFPTCP